MSHQPYRLASGGHIDRDHEIEFTFNGRSYRGHPGDTLASALLANGVHFVGRGFKYHRPPWTKSGALTNSELAAAQISRSSEFGFSGEGGI